MAKTDYQEKEQKCRSRASDDTLTPIVRMRSAKKLLKHTSYSSRAVPLAKRLANLYLESEDLLERKTAAKLLTSALTKESDDDGDDESGETPASIQLPEATLEGLISKDVSFEERLVVLNKDVMSLPWPEKHVYFPAGDRGYLVKKFPAQFLYEQAEDIPEAFFDDPYNELPAPIQRAVNPLFISQYIAWKKQRFGDHRPDKKSTWFLRFCDDETVRVWSKLGTLVVPSEQVVGKELREREHASGFVSPREVPFAFVLWFELLIGEGEEFFMVPYDTPQEFLHEFDGIKTEAQIKADETQEAA
jgi:hypothetical protein